MVLGPVRRREGERVHARLGAVPEAVDPPDEAPALALDPPVRVLVEDGLVDPATVGLDLGVAVHEARRPLVARQVDHVGTDVQDAAADRPQLVVEVLAQRGPARPVAPDPHVRDEEPDERLMRSIEEKIDIPESRKDDFRREIMNYIGALSIDGKTFDYKTNERLYKALELKLFEDQKDSIKLTSLVSNVVDAETQQKIDVVKGRLIRDYGYDDESATDVLNYVASIFARGDVRERK